MPGGVHFFISSFFISSLLCNVAIGAVDGVGAGIIVPRVSFADHIPLRFGAGVGDARQGGAIEEQHISKAPKAVGNGNAR